MLDQLGLGTIAGLRKHQIPNTKLQRNPKLQVPKYATASLPWGPEFGVSLVFGAWFLELSFWFEEAPDCRSIKDVIYGKKCLILQFA